MEVKDNHVSLKAVFNGSQDVIWKRNGDIYLRGHYIANFKEEAEALWDLGFKKYPELFSVPENGQPRIAIQLEYHDMRSWWRKLLGN